MRWYRNSNSNAHARRLTKSVLTMSPGWAVEIRNPVQGCLLVDFSEGARAGSAQTGASGQSSVQTEQAVGYVGNAGRHRHRLLLWGVSEFVQFMSKLGTSNRVREYYGKGLEGEDGDANEV